MTNKNTPYLCGGTFFVLLLQAKRLRRKARDKYQGGTDGLNDTDVMKGLIYVVTGQAVDPYNDSFKKNTSEYKSCKYNGGTYIPFNEVSTVSSFDNAIKSKYSDTLDRMSEFTNEYLIVENSEKREWLIKALLDVIEQDVEIKDEDLFYICSNGDTISKSALFEILSIEFEPFLIGVLHYILLNRNNNTLGRSTFESWHTRQSSHSEWNFVSNIGCAVTRPITVFMMAVKKEDYNDFAEDEEEPEIIIEDATAGASTQNVTQIVNNPTIVNQYGEKNIHIDRVDTLNL
ncbi:MAG: hypothetical protein EOM28_05180 [Clostridia bacterium]|nr:hypothetical protein [Clostridia bacterium]